MQQSGKGAATMHRPDLNNCVNKIVEKASIEARVGM